MTIADDYRDRRVLVIGYGRTGVAVSRFLLDAGARVRVAERRPAAELVDVDGRIELQWLGECRPRVGVLLNVTEDHLDRYVGLDAYGATKLRLFARQTADDVAVLNGGDPWIRQHATALAASTLWFGAGEGVALRA